MGRSKERTTLSMNRDEWKQYCELSKSGDAEALREYLRALEQRKKDSEDDRDV